MRDYADYVTVNLLVMFIYFVLFCDNQSCLLYDSNYQLLTWFVTLFFAFDNYVQCIFTALFTKSALCVSEYWVGT